VERFRANHPSNNAHINPGGKPDFYFTCGGIMADPTQDRELKNALSAIEKQFGKGAIMQLNNSTASDVLASPPGALSLDVALAARVCRAAASADFRPGIERQTTVALHAVANAQRQGGVAAFIDAEHALDPSWPSASAWTWKPCSSASRRTRKKR